MKLIDAVYEVLKDSAAPMGAMEIERAILDRGLYETKGKTLYASVAAAIYIDIKKQGAASRFAKCGKGMFALAGRAAAKVKRESSFSAKSQTKSKRRAEANPEGGYVYILTNQSFRREWVKIGKTCRKVNVRSTELDNTAVPLPFEVFATMWTAEYEKAERLIHKMIDRFTKKRIRKNREFFNIGPEKALEIFEDVSMVFDDAVIERFDGDEVNRKKSAKPKPASTATWKNPTQLAKFLAEQGGNIKAAGGIFLQLTGKRRVVKDSKWRKPMAEAGVRFDSNDMVIGW